jgi:DNA polymerase-3 subunit beta
MLSATIEAGRLQDAAPWVARLVSAKRSIPVLQGILIESDDDTIRLSAYDLDTAGTAILPAVVRQPGRVVVAGRLLAAIAKVLDAAKDVSFADDGSRLRVTSGRNEWILPELDVDDFPILPKPPDRWAKIDTGALRRALRRILPCAHREITDPIGGTVRIIGAGQTLRVVACDIHRAAMAEIDYEPPEIDFEIDIQVPTIFLDDAIAVLPPSGAAGEFGTTLGAVALATPSQRLLGRLGAAKWPPLERVFPTFDAEVSAIFDVAPLAEALARASVLMDEDHGIRLDMSPEGFEFDALAATGSACAEAPVVEYRGPAKVIGIKPSYLKSALDTVDSERAMLRTLPRPSAPLDFVPLDANGTPVPDFRYIMMPVDLRKVTQ